jgi:hypothetical protein
MTAAMGSLAAEKEAAMSKPKKGASAKGTATSTPAASPSPAPQDWQGKVGALSVASAAAGDPDKLFPTPTPFPPMTLDGSANPVLGGEVDIPPSTPTPTPTPSPKGGGFVGMIGPGHDKFKHNDNKPLPEDPLEEQLALAIADFESCLQEVKDFQAAQDSPYPGLAGFYRGPRTECDCDPKKTKVTDLENKLKARKR